ncbi:CDP-glycerol glycerophosphotransferase family protein [Campylobacter coli]|nr:CDP-glycerol glycerophosphotransferase family protein [Campylobacter coli]EMA9374707.1 CDP-glycerol glycerophosphotransferase family protein [Campylobacter coli]
MSKISKLLNNPKLFFKDMILNLIRKKYNIEENLPNVLCGYPIVLHTGEQGENALSHISMWYLYFKKSEVNFIIIVRCPKALKLVQDRYPEVSMVYLKDKKEVDIFFNTFSSIKACFYPSNTGNNFHLFYQTHIKHIFIGHGDSDKSSSAHKFFRAYDENWVAGEAHIDRMLNAGFNLNGLKHLKTGRPNLLGILKKSKLDWRDRFEGRINLLYLPTWEGTYKEQDYSSLGMVLQNIKKLQDYSSFQKINISVKLHPFSGKKEKRFLKLEYLLSKEKKIRVISKYDSLHKYIINSNMFICDISAVVSECLAVNAPIFLYIPKDKNIKIAQSNMPYEEYCYIFSSPEELSELVYRVVSGDDFLWQNRLKAQKYIINTEDTLKETFIKQLQKISEDNSV